MGRVLQVIGYQNSGKTTFVVDYIKEAVKNELKLGTIKHHGHASEIHHHDNKKDTGKHREAGALVSVIEGNGSLILNSESISFSLEQLVKLYSHFSLDVIVVEGYKAADYPKVVLIRSTEDAFLLENITNVLCIVSEVQLPAEIVNTYKLFENNQECIKWLITNEAGESIE